MSDIERWKFIDGYENRYLISDRGRVLSLTAENPKILKPELKRDGYYRVTLFKENTGKVMFVHRLVAYAFIPIKFGHPFVNHKNEIKVDNRAENLEWCTHQYNVAYSSHKLRKPSKRGTLTGEHHITIEKSTGYIVVQWRDCVAPEYKSRAHKKRFKTLEEAVEFRDQVFGAL